MTNEETYKRLDFINNLVKPWDELHLLLLQPYSLDPKFSDPVIAARSLAITVTHQFDVDKNEQGAGINDDELKNISPSAMRIKDLCNTIKHVSRTRGNSADINGISAHVILDENNKFCFIRNQITYNHEVDGEFDLLDDLQKAIYFWSDRRNIDISMLQNWHGSAIKVQPTPPSDAITLFHDSNICIHQKSQGLKLFKVDDSGELIPTDHDNIVFQVVGLNNLMPFASIKLKKRNTEGIYIEES